MARSTTETPAATPPATLAQRAAAIVLENKGTDVIVLNLKGITDMTDFFVIASGTSDTHVRALGHHVIDDMKKDLDARANHVEGLEAGRWVLLDYVDFVVHIFHPSLRQFYQLERLWGDAEVVHVGGQG